MPTKSPAKKKAAAERPSSDITIDFPQEGEPVFPGHYAIRISAEPGTALEINPGGQEWFGCRESFGHYWFDWWATPGEADLSLRTKGANGKWKTVARRSCTVSPGGNN